MYRLKRVAQSPDGTYGRLEGHGLDLCTAEEEWRDNERNESRIPAGRYLCVRTTYWKYGYETFEITGVPGRDRILFHPGNTEEDSDGCVLPGLDFGAVEVIDEETGEKRLKLGVLESKAAFKKFMQHFEGANEFPLEVVDPEWNI